MTKQGLRGFAGGLIVATLLLSYVYFFHSDQTSTPTITEADIESYAEKNSLVILSKDEYNNLTKQKDTAAKTAKEEENKNDNKQAKNNEDKNKEKQEKPIAVNFEIKPGMSTAAVGEELQKLKLISNKSEFTNYIKKHKLESSVKAGSYKLNSDMTVEEIAAILTK